MSKTSFDEFAENYDKTMGDNGDYTHQNTIDPALFEAIGDFKNKIIYDIGCGNGYISRKLVRGGAKEVWASDISPSSIELAETKYDVSGIKYLVQDGSEFKNIPESYFDLVIMNMVIHYIPSLDIFFGNVARTLKDGGRFIFTTDHPFHSLSYLDIKKIDDLEEVMSDARRYTSEHVKRAQNNWKKDSVINVYKRPISLYVNLLRKHGLYTDTLIEPPTKRVESYENPNPLYSPIPFKFALGASKI